MAQLNELKVYKTTSNQIIKLYAENRNLVGVVVDSQKLSGHFNYC